MTKTIENLFFYSALGTDLLVLFLFIFFLKDHKRNRSIIFIACYCLLNLLLNITGKNKFVSHDFMYYAYASFTFLEFLLFSAVFWQHINSQKFKRVIIILSVVFFISLIFYYFSQTNFRSIDSVPIGIETIIILIYSFYYLFEQMNDLDNSFIYNKFHFWLVIGIMLYLAGSFFIYVFANQVDQKTLKQFWLLTNVFYIIKNILFAVAILIHAKQSKVSSPRSHKKMYPYLN
jgi:hypothetical protein